MHSLKLMYKYKGHANGADPSLDHDAATDPPLGAA